MAAVLPLKSSKSPESRSMGGNAWVPYLIGAVVGHLGTLGGWIVSSLVESYTGKRDFQHPGSLNLFPEHPSTFSFTSTTTFFQTGKAGWIRDGDFEWSSALGGNSVWLWLVAITSWCVSGLLCWVLCRKRPGAEPSEPQSPTLQELARSQLAEVRLRKHGIGQSHSPP